MNEKIQDMSWAREFMLAIIEYQRSVKPNPTDVAYGITLAW